MIYAFVDTNIFIRIMSQGKPGCEPVMFDKLQTLVAGGIIRLLVPDIILGEIEQEKERCPEAIKEGFDKLKERVGNPKAWSEIIDAQDAVLSKVDSLHRIKKQSWRERCVEVDTFLRSDIVTRLAYTPDIEYRAKVWCERGIKPRKSQDAGIIATLVSFFETNVDDNPELLFCSENHNDFATRSVKEGVRRYDLNLEICKVLPTSHYFTQLDELLQIDKGYESLPEPPKDEEITQAIIRMHELETEEGYDSGEYIESLEEVRDIYDRRLSNEFIANIYPHLNPDIRERRDEVYYYIEDMLRQCRECPSWDDRSEMKLPQWLDHVPEHMIRHTTLANLFRIEKSVERYLHIHEEREREAEDT